MTGMITLLQRTKTVVLIIVALFILSFYNCHRRGCPMDFGKQSENDELYVIKNDSLINNELANKVIEESIN